MPPFARIARMASMPLSGVGTGAGVTDGDGDSGAGVVAARPPHAIAKATSATIERSRATLNRSAPRSSRR
jgi:hypothetical protein